VLAVGSWTTAGFKFVYFFWFSASEIILPKK